MGIGKKTWSEELKPKVGAFEKFDLHNGLARYALVPLSAGLTLASNRPDLDSTNLLQQRQVNEVPQIRIERMEVQIKGRNSVSTAAWYNNVASVSVRCPSFFPRPGVPAEAVPPVHHCELPERAPPVLPALSFGVPHRRSLVRARRPPARPRQEPRAVQGPPGRRISISSMFLATPCSVSPTTASWPGTRAGSRALQGPRR